MRVWHVLSHLRLGAGRYIVDLALEQVRRGDAVAVCVSPDRDDTWRSDARLIEELESGGIELTVLSDVFPRDTAALRRAASTLRDRAVTWTDDDVTHAHTAMAAAVSRWSGSPVVAATCHGWNPQRTEDLQLQDALAFSLCDGISSPSRHWAARVLALAPLREVQVLPYGLDLRRYPVADDDAGPEAGTRRVACVGELTHRKGQDVVITAMPEVWRVVPDAELHLIGSGDDEAALRELARRIDPAGTRITFHGWVEHPYRWLRQYSVMCLPTRSDNQPLAIIEAMLAGVPVVASDVGGIADLIARAGTGATVPPNDPAALAARLVAQLLHSTSPSDRLRRECAGRARELFDIRTHAAAIAEWYADARRARVRAGEAAR